MNGADRIRHAFDSDGAVLPTRHSTSSYSQSRVGGRRRICCAEVNGDFDAIRKEFPAAQVIVLTTFEADEDIYRAIQSGAKSYLLKDTPYPEIADAIRLDHVGQQILPPKIASLLNNRLQRADLSDREMAVLRLLVKGRSNKEIGASLFIAEDTVKSYLKTLFVKLKVHDRTGAVISAIRHGIVHLE